MTRFLMMLVVAGALAAPVMGGTRAGGAADDAVTVLPAETLEALAMIREVSAARTLGESAQVVDEKLAAGVRRLAASLERIPEGDGFAFAEMLRLEVAVLGPEMVARLRAGMPADDSPVARAMEELRAAKGELVDMGVNAGSNGPTFPCFSNLADCFVHCSNLPTWWQRSLCGLDCEVDFLNCAGQAYPWPPIKRPGGPGGPGTVGSP